MELEVWKLEEPGLGVSALVPTVVGFPQSWWGLFWTWEQTLGLSGYIPLWVLFQGPGNYLLWWELKWAGGVGRGIQNVYEGVGLYGSWGSWRVGQCRRDYRSQYEMPMEAVLWAQWVAWE